jgi:hypothetical protein
LSGAQLVEQCLGLLEVRCGEALGKSVIDRREEGGERLIAATSERCERLVDACPGFVMLAGAGVSFGG